MLLSPFLLLSMINKLFWFRSILLLLVIFMYLWSHDTVKEITRKWLEAKMVSERKWKWILLLCGWLLGRKRTRQMGWMSKHFWWIQRRTCWFLQRVLKSVLVSMTLIHKPTLVQLLQHYVCSFKLSLLRCVSKRNIVLQINSMKYRLMVFPSSASTRPMIFPQELICEFVG